MAYTYHQDGEARPVRSYILDLRVEAHSNGAGLKNRVTVRLLQHKVVRPALKGFEIISNGVEDCATVAQDEHLVESFADEKVGAVKVCARVIHPVGQWDMCRRSVIVIVIEAMLHLEESLIAGNQPWDIEVPDAVVRAHSIREHGG